MQVDEDYNMGLNAITKFLADAGAPSSEHEENQQAETQATSPPKEESNNGRVIRRRARKACVECHKRKVRCDVLTRGQVCTNCRLDGLPCRLPARDGRRRNQLIPPQTKVQTEIPPTQIAVPPPTSLPTTIISNEKPVSDIPSFIPIRDETPSFCNAWQFRPSQNTLSSVTISSTSHIEVIFSYFGFLESESLSHIPPEDFKFMENKGCFHVPIRPVLDEFIKTYFMYVHPTLPILNEGQFWDMYLGDSRLGTSISTKMSLFLFRAILFVSSSFVSEDLLKQMGFGDAFEARLNFYRRAKLLFDFDTTSDPISIAQAALLLTYYSSDREALANTSWLRVAIQYAQQERAHLYDQTPSISYSDRLVRKWLWWCCVLRDRILPLGVRRSIQITHAMFALQSSTPLNAFDLEPELSYSKVYDAATKTILNKVFQKQVELAIILTDVLELIYPVGQLDYNAMMKMPVQIALLRGRLEAWLGELQAAIGSSEKSSHKSVSLFLGLPEIYYHSAQAALCQYESLALQANGSRSSTHRNKELGTQLNSSIASISKIVGELVQLDVARFLPVSAVAYMALPIILNSIDLQNTKVDRSEERGDKLQTKRHQLRLYNEAMSLCHARYSGTGQCLRYIDASIASAKTDLTTVSNSSKSLISGNETEERVDLSKAALARLTQGENRMDDWFEAFVSKPRSYLRIALPVDLWMSIGKMAGHEDFPRVLMLEDNEQLGSVLGIGIPRSLRQPISDEDANRIIRELVEDDQRVWMNGEKRRSDLDYFDFGSAGTTGSVSEINDEMLSGAGIPSLGLEAESEMGSNSVENENEMGSEGEGDSGSLDHDWDGVMVEGILEDVLGLGHGQFEENGVFGS